MGPGWYHRKECRKTFTVRVATLYERSRTVAAAPAEILRLAQDISALNEQLSQSYPKYCWFSWQFLEV